MAKYSHHDYYLHRLIHNLRQIDENLEDACWIMKNGLYYKKNNKEQNKLCDLIIGYYDNHGLCVELKGSQSQRSKAISQLKSSSVLAYSHLNFDSVVFKIAYYEGNDKYSYEDVTEDIVMP